MRDACYFLGRRDDIPRVINAFDIATSSSTSEAFPNALAEAMACGIPGVVTDVGDSRSILGDTGSVVPLKDPKALARAWAGLILAGPTLANASAKPPAPAFRPHFAMPNVVRRYEALYTGIAASWTCQRTLATLGSPGSSPFQGLGSPNIRLRRQPAHPLRRQRR